MFWGHLRSHKLKKSRESRNGVKLRNNKFSSNRYFKRWFFEKVFEFEIKYKIFDVHQYAALTSIFDRLDKAVKNWPSAVNRMVPLLDGQTFVRKSIKINYFIIIIIQQLEITTVFEELFSSENPNNYKRSW